MLVEQYRYGIDRVTLELPAGAIDPGEAPEAAARRELREETGYEADAWVRLGALAVEPGDSISPRLAPGAFTASLDGLLDVDDLPDDIVPTVDGDSDTGRSYSGADGLVGRPLAAVERFYIEQALELADGKREDAAALLGIGERTLYRKIKEYELRET